MPIIFMVLLFFVFLFGIHCFSTYRVIKNKDFARLKSNIINNLVFLFCLLSVLIQMNIFWKIGVYVDETNISPAILYGGDFWNMVSWFTLLFPFIACILSSINLFNTKK